MWKDEVIETEAAGRSFLSTRLSKITGYTAVPRLSNHSSIYVLNFSSRNNMTLLSFSVRCGDKELIWNSINVCTPCAGQGLGSQTVKAVLGLAKERGCTSLLLESPTTQGYSFWPALGALPLNPPEKMSDYLNRALALYGGQLEGSTHYAWQQIVKLAKTDPIAGWRALAQHKAPRTPSLGHQESPYSTAKSFAFRNACELGGPGNLKIDLTDEETLAVLSRRVGALPDFSNRRKPPLYG